MDDQSSSVPKDVVVLGAQLAAARAAEEKRLQEGTSPSPMPPESYDRWRGDADLLRPVPLALDDDVARVCRRFASTDPAEREALRRAIGMDEFYTLLTFADRMAVFSLRERSTERLRDGLLAVAMVEADRVDDRDVVMTLSVLSHTAARLGDDARRLFASVAQLATVEVAEFFRDTAHPHDLRPAAGLYEVETKYGIGLIGWGLEPYAPTIDMVGLAVDVAEMVGADRYMADRVEIASELPDVWLRPARDDRLQSALAHVRAGATVGGALRPEDDDSHFEEQNFLTFLVELSDMSHARILRDISDHVHADDFSALGAAHGRLFGLIVAGSNTIGVPSVESVASIQRFRPELESILSKYAR